MKINPFNRELQKDQQDMIARSKLQTAMNSTRNKLNRGKFKPENFEIVPLTVKTEKIEDEFDNYTIVHITDIHLGQWLNKEKLDGVVDIINSLHPDLIALTGDYVSYKATEYLHDLESSLKKLKPKDETISVLGNHDHWTNANAIKQVLKNANVINLENDIYTINKNDAKLQIAGVDSITLGKDNINKIEKKLDHKSPAIMLAHEPDFADKTAQLNPFILQLSGHSHGGQITIPKIGTPIRGSNFKKYPSGEYEVNNMIQYTNRGIGTNGFWFRINCPPEITNITLKKVE